MIMKRTVPIHISRPQLKHADILSAMQLNGLRFGNKHTILTPGRLRSATVSAK